VKQSSNEVASRLTTFQGTYRIHWIALSTGVATSIDVSLFLRGENHSRCHGRVPTEITGTVPRAPVPSTGLRMLGFLFVFLGGQFGVHRT